jgi:hypothetical protein
VVAEADDVCTGGEKLVRELGGDAGSVRCVLAVDDRQVGVVPLAERGQMFLDGAPTGDAEDVREEEDLQGRRPS